MKFNSSFPDVKRCNVCKLEKLASEYNKYSASPDGLNKKCRECQKAYDKEYWRKSEKHRARTAQSTEKSRIKAYGFVAEYLTTHPCVDCGESDPIVLEFDHVRGTKISDISTMKARGFCAQALTLEIAKCEVRCANCHRRVTYYRRKDMLE